MELLLFTDKNEVMGIESQFVLEILEDKKVFPVPLSPPPLAGHLYHRGDIFTVIDMGILAGKGSARLTGSRRIILLKWQDKNLSLMPEAIIGLACVKAEPPPASVVWKERPVRILAPEEIWNQFDIVSNFVVSAWLRLTA